MHVWMQLPTLAVCPGPSEPGWDGTRWRRRGRGGRGGRGESPRGEEALQEETEEMKQLLNNTIYNLNIHVQLHLCSMSVQEFSCTVLVALTGICGDPELDISQVDMVHAKEMMVNHELQDEGNVRLVGL